MITLEFRHVDVKARKLIFINPTRGMKITPVNNTVPLPLDTEAIRQALNSPDPAVALAVALVAFHALTGKQLTELALTDIVDGRLALNGRTIPLAGAARECGLGAELGAGATRKMVSREHRPFGSNSAKRQTTSSKDPRLWRVRRGRLLWWREN